MPRLDSDQWVMLALAVLDQARDLAREPGRVPRTHALRLALAWLFTRSRGNRAPFDAFWRICGRSYAGISAPAMAATHRCDDLTRAWQGILREIGVSQAAAEAAGARLNAWQVRENKAVLEAAIREQRRAREAAKDARECFSPNGQNLPPLIKGRAG